MFQTVTDLVAAWKAYITSHKLFVIYCHTHVASGKKYVGQTCRSMEARWKNHLLDANNNKGAPQLSRMIREFGAEAFHGEVLEEVVGQNEANLAEARWIEKLDCVFPKGMNLTKGGSGIYIAWSRMSPEVRSAIVRNRMSKITHEEQSAAASKRLAALTPEQRVEKSRKVGEAVQRRWDKMPLDERASRIERFRLSKTPEQNSADIQKAIAAAAARTTESKHKTALDREAAMTSEQRSERSRTGRASMTTEEKSACALKGWVTKRANATAKLVPPPDPPIQPPAE